ncbi:CheR family methyltransferase [Variovorax sp. RCC_210]|uniref:CheR family methyltransferase n=1 Tax=Variovorax sp. RCC_210 TaxID=3239217 RepID=UPI0035247E5A
MDDLTPDHFEEALADQIDDAVPSRGYSMLPVVGLGGSTGGMEALRTLLETTPPDTGVAFVVVLHMSAAHEAALAQELQRATSMRVVPVSVRERITPNTVYVAAPGKALRTRGKFLEVADIPPGHGRHVAVDYFFRALADTHGPHAVAVVMSGVDGDGAIGVKRIKERGGLTVAQEPEEASHNGMVQSAIATGMIDWVLPVREIGARIRGYLRMETRLRLPPEILPPDSADDPGGMGRDAVQAAARGARGAGGPAVSVEPADEAAFREVLGFVRSRTGRDFVDYKRATVLRRIGRRMQVNSVDNLAAYLDCLRTRPGEAGALLQDMLISVTNFFRDSECFHALEGIVHDLFRNKSASDTVRVWVVACATGEEAYSLAMLLSEHARTMESPPSIQIFATDIDEDAIRIARDGLYPSAVEADVSQERLRRFFVREPRGYRVRRDLREMVLFAVHDVLTDSPFSRVDLATCRNLLIYLNRDAQARVFDTLHFSLVNGGRLFLGASETVEENSPLFALIDRKHRLYAQRHVARAVLPIPAGRSSAAIALDLKRSGPVIPTLAVAHALRQSGQPPQSDGRPMTWTEVHLKLLDRLAPPTILVDAEHEMLHISPGATQFLHFSGGEPSRNVLRAIVPDLRAELQTALYHVGDKRMPVEVAPVPVRLGDEQAEVSLKVQPVDDFGGGLLVTLQREAQPRKQPKLLVARVDAEPISQHLEREVARLKAQLRETVEQYETSTEELKASNEELHAMNEELHSATEELETSREELQSINEELTTVNHELKSKVEDLGHANSDMQNLMDATAIATVFLDREFRVTRFTPSAVAVFKLIATDVGRPLSDLTTPLDYSQLTSDLRSVLLTLQPSEREVGDDAGRWYLARVRPYRTIEDHIAGVVLTFVDITERKEAQESLRQSQERFSAIVNQASVGVAQARLDGTLTFTNTCYCRLMGYDERELAGTDALELVHGADRQAARLLFERLAEHGEAFQTECRNLRRDGSFIWLHKSVTVLTDAEGRPGSALIVCSDISERKFAEDALRESEERFRLVLENAVDYAIFSMDLERRVKSWNTGAERLLGYSEAEILGRLGDIIFTDEDRAAGAPQEEAAIALAQGRAADDRLHQCKDGSRFWASGALMPMHNGEGAVIGMVKVLRDQSEQRAAEEEVEQSRAELLDALRANESARKALVAADAAKDRFLAVLSHELRNPLASISGAAELLAPESLPAQDQARAARVIRRQSTAMKVLLGDLLDVSSLRRGRLVLRRDRVSAQNIADAAVEATRPLIERAGHVLRVHVAPQQDIWLDADPIRLAQVVSNLLSNAAKYTPDGGHLTLEVSSDKGEAVFEVTDDGIGMDPHTVEAMFEMFTQSEHAHARAAGGLGIGLALVRSIVELHGGTVRGQSDGQGRGSRFTVRIPQPGPRASAGPALAPAAAAAPESAPEPAAVSAPTPAPALPIAADATGADGARRVLLADDNVDAVWGMARMLALAGFTVETAHNGTDALAIAERFRPEAVVLDIGMPDIDGHEVARRIRAQPWGGGMYLVAATGWGQPDDKRAALEAGFDEHLVKPVAAADVQRLLRTRGRTDGEPSAAP